MPVSAHACRLRTGRFSEAGRIYLVTAVVRNREPIFNDFHLARSLINELRRTDKEGWVKSLAWVVMPDHFHWLVEIKCSSLSAVMQRTKSRAAMSIGVAQGRPLKLWQKGYHDRAIRYDEDVVHAARYIVANPLRAGLVKRLGDYPHWDAIWL
ncbi:REP-associated tyrosine transposase [Pseudomonas sp. CCC3.1]|uniref:REP-associated tyrosine transposase n=1 Tax=Pseudomonas sp. CCC3.1 TaxID=3048607 RepID=UPI002AC8FBB3|nr:transposase [Pseudomonas sp. CCC3.1]MEB0208761.1 transposase [Pseudomonas sp. CCC3.1]WPX36335.1 transposase [Pseudomonas sp. CCC3.1]